MNKLKLILYAIPLLLLFLVPPKIDASTTEYNLIFRSEQYSTSIQGETNTFSTHNEFHTTDLIPIIDNTLILGNNSQYIAVIVFYDSNQQVLNTYYNSRIDGFVPSGVLGSVSEYNNIIPTNSYYFSFLGITTNNYITGTISDFSQFQTITASYENPTPTPDNITDPFNIVWNDDTWIDINGAEVSQQYYYVTDMINVSTLTDYEISAPAGVNPNFGGLAPTVTHIWYYDTDYSLISSYNAYSDFAYYTPDLTQNASYIRFGSPVTNLGGYEPNQIKQTYITTTQRTIKFYDINQNFLHSFFADVGDDTADYIALVTPPAVEGYQFTGWTGPETVQENGDTEMYAIYQQRESYTVIFLDYNGALLGEVTVFQGENAIPPVTPTREGYNFTGWLPPVADVQGNITTVAQYEIIQDSFFITWRNTDFSTMAITEVTSGVTPISPQRNGYTRTWAPEILPATEHTFYTLISEVETVQSSGITETSGTIIYRTQLPDDYSGITDLFGGVFGAIIGTVMILGTIDLFGVQLASLLWFFFAGTGFLMVWKLVK
jgi:hypothetical protein